MFHWKLDNSFSKKICDNTFFVNFLAEDPQLTFEELHNVYSPDTSLEIFQNYQNQLFVEHFWATSNYAWSVQPQWSIKLFLHIHWTLNTFWNDKPFFKLWRCFLKSSKSSKKLFFPLLIWFKTWHLFMY